jgi:hypothetical protein
MVAPLIIAALTPFVKDLFANGLSMLGNAVLSKGKVAVEEKLGVKLPDEGQPLSPEQLVTMRQLQFDHEEALLELGIKKQELELDELKVTNENTAGARRMNAEVQESANAAKIAKVAPYILDFLIVGVTLLLSGIILFHGVPTENKEVVYTAFGSLITMCMTILNFHRGTSQSSKNKDDVIAAFHKGGQP